MWQRFSETSRHAIMQAEQNALMMRSSQVNTEHLLLSLLNETNSISTQILQNFGVTAEQIRPEPKPNDEQPHKDLQLSLAEIEALRAHLKDEQSQKDLQLSLAEVEALGTNFKVNTDLIRQLERQLILKLAEKSKRPQLKLSPQVKRVLELAADEARRTQNIVKHSNYIGPEHLLLGLLRNEESSAAQILHKLGVDLEQARTAVVEYLQARNN